MLLQVDDDGPVLCCLGRYQQPVAYRSNVMGFIGMPEIIPLWNVEKS